MNMEVEQPNTTLSEKLPVQNNNTLENDVTVNGDHNVDTTKKHPLQNRCTMWYDNPGKKNFSN